MPSAGAPRCPNCPYGKFRTELASVGLRERWADREGACWSYGRDGCAWWHLCQQCHLIDRPYDFRTRNASSRPGVAWHTFKGDVDISIDGFKGGGCLQEGCSRVPGARPAPGSPSRSHLDIYVAEAGPRAGPASPSRSHVCWRASGANPRPCVIRLFIISPNPSCIACCAPPPALPVYRLPVHSLT